MSYHTVWLKHTIGYGLEFMARKTQQDWFDLALKLLMQAGADALTIDNMTTQLNVTKGSFYHHFGSYDGFKQALLSYFEDAGTFTIVQRIETMDTSPAERLKALIAITLEHPSSIEVTIRTWAQRDPDVYAYQMRVDQRRITFVTNIWLEMIDDPTEARRRAEHLYTILVGGEHIIPPIEGKEKQQLYAIYLRLYGIT